MQAFRMLLVLTFLTGIIYPLLMTGIAQVIFPHRANGSMIVSGDRTIGSELVGQKFTHPGYFWSRPSATDYNPLPSSGSNLGPTSAALTDLIGSRQAALDSAHGKGVIPADLLYASGSGIDPHISPEAAYFQVDRVARARGFDVSKTQQLRELVQSQIEGRTLGIIGEPRVNVVLLNMSLDSLDSR